MKKIILTICAIYLGLVCTASQAIIDLELTQGVAAAIPIALSIQPGDDIRVAGNQTVNEVIRNDLQNSGEFRVVNQQANALLNMEAWRQMGADYVVTGTIVASGSNRYTIHFQLNTAFNDKENLAKSSDAALLDGSFTSDQQALRGVLHRISDEIYQKLTGVRGIFSTRVAYVVVTHPTRESSHYVLEVADADGFNAHTLLNSNEPIMSPAWTPDGRELAYVSFEGHRAAIYLQNLASGKRYKISSAPGINGAPSFSSDGRYMAMVLSKSGNPNIYLLDRQAARYRPVISDVYIDTEPSFSADGGSFLFTSNRDGTPQIYQYVLATGKISRVTYGGNYNAKASFVPNTQDIIMMHRVDQAFGIARLDLNSGQIQTLVQTGADESPSISANGKMVIYATQYGGRGVLAQVSVDGRIKLRLPAREGSVQEPAWSPFLNL